MEFAKVLAAAFTAGAPGTELAAPDGSRMRVLEPDQPGVERMLRGEGEEGEWQLRLYKPAPTAPDGYPDEYPFLANEAFCIMHFPGPRTMLVWWGKNGAANVGRLMVEHSERNGWSRLPNQPMTSDEQAQLKAMGISQQDELQFHKGDRIRNIMHSSFGPLAFASMTERAVPA